jgi:hypothetical protein
MVITLAAYSGDSKQTTAMSSYILPNSSFSSLILFQCHTTEENDTATFNKLKCK